MIDDILFSIAGKKEREEIDEVLESLLQEPSITRDDKTVLAYTLEVVKQGAYPSKKYYAQQGYEAIKTTNSISEIRHEAAQVIEEWRYEALRKKIIAAVNESSTSSQLMAHLETVAEQQDNSEDFNLDDYTTTIDEPLRTSNNGYKLNINEVDSLTGGLQPGTLATLCAYTGHGKTTLAVSSAYFNLKKGKHGVVFSLELAPSLSKLQFYSRWLYEEKNIELSPRAMVDGSMDDDMREKYDKYLPEFNEFIGDKLIIVDEALLNKQNISNYKVLNKLYRALEQKIGHLDWVMYDHINQVELMFPDYGNIAVRTMMSATKIYTNTEGEHPVTLLCVQANREGHKRAAKRDGKYDMQAMSSLNELERSAFYCVFMYTSDDLKLLQETKICMLKHRMGAVLTEPVSVAFNPAVFVVGETVETVSFAGDMSFLNDKDFSDADFSDEDFGDL